MKYIIKNCPATFQNIDDEYVCPPVCRQEGFPVYCKNNTNCLLKRIAEIFKDFRKDSIVINGNQILVEEILNLLEIEEVE